MPRTISHDEFHRLLSAVDKPAYRLCFSLMYACGLRISQAISITPVNIDSTKMSIRVIGKGNKEGIVPFPESLLRPMREYWKTHRNREWLFPTRHGRGHISAAALRIAFRSACDRVGIDRDVKTHSLRHSYATRLMENGANIREVQVLLRHASISSTQIYTHLTDPLKKRIKHRINNLFSDLL